MPFARSLALTAAVAASAVTSWPHTAQARRPEGAVQICSLGSAGVGQVGTLICKDTASGATTQSLPLGPTVAAAGGIGGSLISRGELVLVTNQAGGAWLFRLVDGALKSPVMLETGGEGSLSGALGEHGAYVLTGTQLRFFPYGQTVATSSQKLLLGDGSAAQVTLAGRTAYVSEKNGSLEAFALDHRGRLAEAPMAVAGISPGVIVGITGATDLVVAPIAHLASNFAEAEISVVSGNEQVQRIPTKEVAACWTASEGDEVCVANPGSMTVSCGAVGTASLESFTGAAASLPGESVFDLDMRHGLVGLQGIKAGQPVLLVYRRAAGDFLAAVNELPLGTDKAAGALLLPAMSR